MKYEDYEATILDILDVQDKVMAIDLKTQELVEKILKEIGVGEDG